MDVFFYGYYMELNVLVFGLVLVILNVWCIRTQFMVSESQYKLGMIHHHSMAIHMSKKLLKKENKSKKFLQNLIKTQENEILILKQ